MTLKSKNCWLFMPNIKLLIRYLVSDMEYDLKIEIGVPKIELQQSTAEKRRWHRIHHYQNGLIYFNHILLRLRELTRNSCW